MQTSQLPAKGCGFARVTLRPTFLPKQTKCSSFIRKGLLGNRRTFKSSSGSDLNSLSEFTVSWSTLGARKCEPKLRKFWVFRKSIEERRCWQSPRLWLLANVPCKWLQTAKLFLSRCVVWIRHCSIYVLKKYMLKYL